MSDFENATPTRRRAQTADPSRVDRLPPSALPAEQGVLGCILLSPKECLGEVRAALKTEKAFYDLRHQVIFECLCDMEDVQDAIDMITLGQLLRDRQQIEAVGGLVYLSSLTEAVPSAANLQYYLSIVHEKWVLRQIIQTCTDVVGRVYEHEGECEALLGEVQKDILAISADNSKDNEIPIREWVRRGIANIEGYYKSEGKPTGIPSGFIDLDKMTNGFKAADYIIIAARPSIGKTALCMNIAEYVAVDLKEPVGVFSLEMSGDSLTERMLTSRARVNMRKVKDGFMSEQDFPKLTGAAGRLAASHLHIDDTGGLSILQLRARARKMHQKYGIKLFVVDYLQLLHSTDRKSDNRQQEITDISCGIKNMAKELGVPVIAISQLNREMERDKNRRPRLSDLRESGSLEQDGDIIGLLWKRTNEDDDSYTESDSHQVTLVLAKQRNGPTGDVNLTFFKSYTRFESAAKISGDNL